MKKISCLPINLAVVTGLISLVGLTACTGNTPQPPSQANTAQTSTPVKETAPATKPTPTEIAQAPLKEVTIAFATRRDTKDLQNKVDQVTAILSKEVGMPVKGITADETASVEALKANRANVAFLSGRASLKAEQLSGAKMYLAEVRADYSGGKTYNSVFVVPEDSPLKTLADPTQTLEQLRGKRMAFTSETSNSGFKAPSALLRQQFKLESGKDYTPVFSGKHDNSILGVANKDYPAAAIANSVKLRMEARGTVKPEQTKVIYKSETFPTTGYGYV
jgi:phosphonate transport system substrate-binding protein